MHAEQTVFPFASLDFPGRSTISLGEMACRLGCTVQHLLNEVDQGALCGLDIRGAKATRRAVRVPVEVYRAYILTRITGPFRADFLRDLPKPVLRALQGEIEAALAHK